MIVDVALDLIRADQRAQPRTAISTDLVEQYTEDMGRGDEFPPIIVFHDGAVHWIADGFHRYYSAVGLALQTMRCDVREGGVRDAILYSCSANASHGLRRTNADKRRAVMRLLDDEEWSRWSDREIAERCGVSHVFVGKLRPEPAPSGNGYQIEDRTRLVQRGGTVYEQNTSRIGASPRPTVAPPPQPETAPPSAPTPSAARGQASDSIAAETERGGWIISALEDIERIARTLPSENEAVERIPKFMAYSVDTQTLRRVRDWLDSFCVRWDNSKKGSKNVAAE